MTSSIFKNKEHYLNFKAAWSAAVNSEKAKSQHIPGCGRVKGWIKAYHHVLYNIIRKRSANIGFTPITNANKLASGITNPNQSFVYALHHIKSIIQMAQEIIKTSGVDHEFMNQRVATFLEPFADTITIEMLASINIEEIK